MQARITRLPHHRTFVWLPQPHPTQPVEHSLQSESQPLPAPQVPAAAVPHTAAEPQTWPLPPLSLLLTCRPDRGTVRLQLRPAAVLPLSCAHVAALPWPPASPTAGLAPHRTGVAIGQEGCLPLPPSPWFPGMSLVEEAATSLCAAASTRCCHAYDKSSEHAAAGQPGIDVAGDAEDRHHASGDSTQQRGAATRAAAQLTSQPRTGHNTATSNGTATGASHTRAQWCALQRHCFQVCSSRLAACSSHLKPATPVPPLHAGGDNAAGSAVHETITCPALPMAPSSHALPANQPGGSAPLPADGRPAPSLQAIRWAAPT